MKYLESLNKRGLSVSNLPKALQKKIKDIDFQLVVLKEVLENPKKEFTDSELEDINVIKTSIDELDKYIAHKVNIFDQTKYDEKLAKISKMTKAKQGIKELEVVQEQEVKEPEVEEPEVIEPVVAKVVAIEQESNEVPVQPSTHKPSPAPKPEPVEPKVYVAAPSPAQSPVYEEEQVEEEFERKGDGKPKKMTTGLILMGVGAFFLTWGAVNFFKSRR